MILNVLCPVRISDNFYVPIDQSLWVSKPKYVKVNGGQTPDRPSAPYRRFDHALFPTTARGHSLEGRPGIHMLAFDWPERAFYVGYTADGGDGLLTRLKKHKVKWTGSNLGNIGSNGLPSSTGGVNHTNGWRNFAPSRYEYFKKHNSNDDCADVRLIVCQVDNNDYSIASMTGFRDAICNDFNGIRKSIYGLLWPNCTNNNVQLLNTNYGVTTTRYGHGFLLPQHCP